MTVFRGHFSYWQKKKGLMRNYKKIQNRLKEFYASILDDDPIKSVIKAIFEADSNE